MSAKLFTLGIALFLAVAFSMFIFVDSLNGNLNEATGLIVSDESFPTYLETHPAITSLPKSSSVGLLIGNKNYEIDGRNVYLTDDQGSKDIKITLPEGYETIIGELGLCDAIRKANKDNQLVVDIYASKTTLLFKYRKLLKYGECLK